MGSSLHAVARCLMGVDCADTVVYVIPKHVCCYYTDVGVLVAHIQALAELMVGRKATSCRLCSRAPV